LALFLGLAIAITGVALVVHGINYEVINSGGKVYH